MSFAHLQTALAAREDLHKPAGYRLLITSGEHATKGEFRQWIIKVFRQKGRDAIIAHDGRRWRSYIPVSKYGP